MAKSMSRVMDVFKSLDRNGSGTLHVREFNEAMRQLNVSCTRSDVQAIFDLYVGLHGWIENAALLSRHTFIPSHPIPPQ